MTDNEIIKALECCLNVDSKCADCHFSFERHFCKNALLKQTLDLINRQQQEIERLEIQVITYSKKNYIKGIKDVVKRLKEKCGNTKLVNRILDDLAEEMIGEQE